MRRRPPCAGEAHDSVKLQHPWRRLPAHVCGSCGWFRPQVASGRVCAWRAPRDRYDHELATLAAQIIGARRAGEAFRRWFPSTVEVGGV